jgi:hypothetical protein
VSDELPWGAVGDLVEELRDVATDLVVAIREEGPESIRKILARVPETPPELRDLPGGATAVLAIVCAAMVNQEAPIASLLGWTEAMYPDATEAERSRLHGINVSEPAATVLAMHLHRAQGQPADEARKTRRAEQRRARRTA